MQFEMLYGLTCDIATGGLKMSEIFSRLGGFAGPLVTSSSLAGFAGMYWPRGARIRMPAAFR
jgi:hypothetical protein